VTAQLVNVGDGYHNWSKTFDRDLKDIFSIQDEIATSIADALLQTIDSKQTADIKTAFSKDVSAYDCYLRGRQFFKRFHKRDIEFARQMFRRAIRLDPDFAPAWAGYADCYSFLYMYVDAKPAYQGEANTASERALQLAPELAEAHASRGLAHLVAEKFADAETEFKKAIELNPNLFEAYYYSARSRFHQGDLESAAELFKKAGEVDPTDYQSRCLRVQILRGEGHTELAVKEAKEAIEAVEKNLAWNPDDARAYHLGAGSLITIGDVERGKRWLKRALEMDPDDSVVLYNVACNFATLGEIDTALDFLQQAADHGTVSTAWMLHDDDLLNLRSHPRFAALLARVEAREQQAQLGRSCVNPHGA